MMTELPDAPADFELLPEYAHYRPVARVTLAEAVQMITDAIKLARLHKQKKLLVDITGLTGFEPPSLPNRYFFIRDWAAAAAGEVCLCVVARPEMIDPEKFGVTVGRNAGMMNDVFSTEAEAIDWLQQNCCA